LLCVALAPFALCFFVSKALRCNIFCLLLCVTLTPLFLCVFFFPNLQAHNTFFLY
jgi:hypothetical protein